MLKRIIKHLRWRRVYGRTKRQLSNQAQCRLTLALVAMGALRRW